MRCTRNSTQWGWTSKQQRKAFRETQESEDSRWGARTKITITQCVWMSNILHTLLSVEEATEPLVELATSARWKRRHSFCQSSEKGVSQKACNCITSNLQVYNFASSMDFVDARVLPRSTYRVIIIILCHKHLYTRWRWHKLTGHMYAKSRMSCSLLVDTESDLVITILDIPTATNDSWLPSQFSSVLYCWRYLRE